MTGWTRTGRMFALRKERRIMDKQREEFEKAREILDFTFNGDELLTGRDWDWELWQAAQAAMQPEINALHPEYVRGLESALSQAQKDYGDSFKQLSAANQRIKELEERIRVADAEEPVLWMFTVDGRYYTAKSKAHADSMLRHPDTYLYPDKPEDFPLSPLYLHAQIPAEVELRAEIKSYPPHEPPRGNYNPKG